MKPTKTQRIRRFTPLQRVFHLLLILSFLTQGATGLSRLYIETPWGQSLAWFFGGYGTAGTIHKVVGILMIVGFALHGLYMLSRIDRKQFPKCLFGPDSILPQPRDLLDFFRHIAWFLRLAKPPRFDRWGYWEKFDYWAVFWGIPLLGVTGLILADPTLSGRLIPGWVLNVVLWIHRIESILAMGHVFIIHFFIGHLRRHNFPMDLAMFEGSVDLDALRHEKPDWVERLERTGTLKRLLVPRVPKAFQAGFYIFGYLAMAIGLFLLIGGLVNSTAVTW